MSCPNRWTAALPALAALGILSACGGTGPAADPGVEVPSPVLTSVEPSSGIEGSEVVLTGQHLASSDGTAPTVRFGSTKAAITAATETSLTVTVPSGLTLGGVDVTVEANQKTSGLVPFTLLAFHTLTTEVTGIGAEAATVDASPAAVRCGDNCLRFATGTAVSVTANAGAGIYLKAWSGDCSGDGACSVTMDADHTVTAEFSPANKVFVTSDTFWPDAANPQGSVDAHCQQRAAAAGLTGTFIAWLGTNASTFTDRLGAASGWVRMDGKPFARSMADLKARRTLFPIRVNELGVEIAPDAAVLSGMSGYDCSNWTVTSGGILGRGAAGGAWGAGATYDGWHPGVSCGTPLPLYCFQKDYSVNVPFKKVEGRIAFVTGGGVTPGFGMDYFDTACASAASVAGLPGTYKALVASTTFTAASRFTTNGPTWVRTDGVPVAETAEDLLGPNGPTYVAPLNLDENANPSYFLVLTGAQDLNTLATLATNCEDYTARFSTSPGRVGAPFFSDAAAINAGTNQCDQGGSVYCLQE